MMFDPISLIVVSGGKTIDGLTHDPTVPVIAFETLEYDVMTLPFEYL
jgi:hypothetical protein